MEVFDAVRTVLAVRRFLPEAIPPESVRRILEAGRLTGSSMNRQPWLYIVVDDRQTLRDVGRLATTGPYIAEAGLAVAVAIERTEYAVSDASRAIQSMILTAWSEDIASNWVGFFGLEQVASLLALPDRYDLLAVLAFGRPAKRSARGKKRRKAGSEVFHHGRFGIPFSETSS
jgi:nitroreductase